MRLYTTFTVSFSPCHHLSALPSSSLIPVLTLTCHRQSGQDFSNHLIYKTLESDLHLGRRPDKPRLLGWTNQISLFLPLEALLFSVRTSDKESAGAAIESIHTEIQNHKGITSCGQICQKGLLRMQVRDKADLRG